VTKRAKKYLNNFASGFLSEQFNEMNLKKPNIIQREIISIVSNHDDNRDFGDKIKLDYRYNATACTSSEKYHLSVLERRSSEGAYVIFIGDYPVGHAKKEGLANFVSWCTQERDGMVFPIIGGIYNLNSPGIYTLICEDLPNVPSGFGKITMDELCLSPVRFLQAENVLKKEFPAEYSRRLIREFRALAESNKLPFRYEFDLKLNASRTKYVLEKK